MCLFLLFIKSEHRAGNFVAPSLIQTTILFTLRTFNGKKGFALDHKIKDQCTLIDAMMNLMSGNHISTIHELSATMLTLAAGTKFILGELK